MGDGQSVFGCVAAAAAARTRQIIFGETGNVGTCFRGNPLRTSYFRDGTSFWESCGILCTIGDGQSVFGCVAAAAHRYLSNPIVGEPVPKAGEPVPGGILSETHDFPTESHAGDHMEFLCAIEDGQSVFGCVTAAAHRYTSDHV